MSTEVSNPTPPIEHPREVVWPEWVYPYPAGAVGGLLGGVAVAVIGIGYGLERLASLSYGIDDIRKIERANVA